MKKFLAAFIGIILVIGVVVTGNRGLDQQDIAVFNQAMDEQDDDFGFNNFSIADYPIAFYDGERDYVLTLEGSDYSVNKRKPVLNSIAATAYPVDEHFEVLTPTLEKMTSLVSLMGMGEVEYDNQTHVTTLLHEGFHCYQLTNYYNQIENLCLTAVQESAIKEQVDTNTQAKEMYQQMLKLMKDMALSDDSSQIKELLVQYKSIEEKRSQILSDELLSMENYYTIIEGTAYYIESLAFKKFTPDKYYDKYISELNIYSDGSGKYYHMGMAQCLVLDKLNAEWKNGYDFATPLTELLYKELEK